MDHWRPGAPKDDGAVRHQPIKSLADTHKLTAVQGVAALSLDGLSSVAYGPEAVVVSRPGLPP